MAINHDRLRQLEAEFLPQEDGIGALIRGIHRLPGIREWVTIESVAMAPLPVWQGDHWGLIALITVPTQLADNVPGWLPPWAAIEWSLPDFQVIEKIDLRQRQNMAALRASGSIAAQPVDPTVHWDPASRRLREDELFHALDQFFAAGDAANLAGLSSYYARLLPQEFYLYYHILIPASQSWLRPEATMNTALDDTANTAANHHLEPAIRPDNLPHDLSQSLADWLQQAKALARSFSLPDSFSDLKRLDERRHLPGFRLAVIGEFSRGKSTLINRLLERELLPIGAAPTTATLTSILAGEPDAMEVRRQQAVDIRPLDPASWDDLLAVDTEGQDREVLATVRLTVDHVWLRSLAAELIDTPGVGDLISQRAALVADVLSQCDAAVLIVSATLPFSLTEKAFLEQEVIGRHVSRLLVVVSKLDTINVAERQQVFQILQGRIAQVSADIPVLPAHPLDDITLEATVLDRLRHQIEAMVAQGERQLWRSRQMAGQLADCLGQMIMTGQTALAAAQITQAERKMLLQQAESQFQDTDLQWEQLRIELDRRRIQHCQMLRQRLITTGQELSEALAMELEHAPEPKVWWERDLPFRVRREFISLSRRSEDSLLRLLDEDMHWLEHQLTHTFETQLSQQTSVPVEQLEIQPGFDSLSLTNTKRYRLLTRLGSSAGMICGYLLGGPIGVVISTGVWFLGEQFFDKEVKEQRRLLSHELERSINQAMDRYCQAISDRLHRLYQQLITDLRQEQTMWQTARRTALQASLAPIDNIPWQQLVEQATMLQQEIRAALRS